MSALKAQLPPTSSRPWSSPLQTSRRRRPSGVGSCRAGTKRWGWSSTTSLPLGLASGVLCVLAPDVGLSDESVHPDKVLAPATRSKLRDDVGLPRRSGPDALSSTE